MNPVPTPVREFTIDRLNASVYENRDALGQAAASNAQAILQAAIQDHGTASIILATGNSQLDFLRALRKLPEIDWRRITVFHMDEYLGIDASHPASFPLFLHHHFLDYVEVGAFHPVPNQPADIEKACRDYELLLRENPIDLVALGFGENGHLAFNDPPFADFEDPVWVKVVVLDDVSRQQQVGEGHFATIYDVPKQAITLTIPALLAPKNILCIVPESRKAEAVRACLNQPVSDQRPGSVLRTVNHAHLYLDPESAALLSH
ncbi:MAG: glucosamine-6-phosphate deaminase [Granulosicoccus sp.]|nr:glucosamine-6-phosphate deaminase [Granulosicoccus sp.]